MPGPKPQILPLPSGGGRGNTSVREWGHVTEEGDEGGVSFTPFPAGSLAELCSGKPPPVCFPLGLVCVVTSELRAPLVP